MSYLCPDCNSFLLGGLHAVSFSWQKEAPERPNRLLVVHTGDSASRPVWSGSEWAGSEDASTSITSLFKSLGTFGQVKMATVGRMIS